MTNKARILLYILSIILVLQGCNTNDQDNVSAPPENAPIENGDTSANNENNEQNEQLFQFSSFDLDVEYEGNKSFEVDYDNEREGMEAEIEDTISNVTLKGDEAFERLRPSFENMTFTNDTSEEEVLSEVLDEFELDTDYTKFKLEVTFADGTKKEYKQQGSSK